MLRDFNVDWLQKRVFIPWNAFSGVGQSAAGGGGLRAYESTTSLGAQVAAALVGKLGIGAQNDGGATLIMAPYDLDIKKALRFRVAYTQTAVSGTVTWQIRYLPLIATQAGTAGATVIAAPSTVLDVVIPAASGTVVASDLRYTDWGQINRGILVDTTYGLLVEARCTDAGPVAGLGLIGLEIAYSTRKMIGPRRNIQGGRRLQSDRPLGTIPALSQEGL
jgi:hypothetical protein